MAAAVKAKASEAPKQVPTDELAALEAAGKPLTTLQGEGEQPKFGTARAAGPGPVPRVCHPLERAGAGQRRFKCFADTDAGRLGTLYVLAADAAGAAKVYAEAVKAPPEAVKTRELDD